ncbi:MAG TPA: hypothetical protein VGP62_07480 [Bryobacteraceae bacterium]|jgi:hypothetical protein|nr:hypothetical protein [Bryobacteraceae bacterium]
MIVARLIRTGALCISVFLASGQLVWGGQSNPPEKDKEQAGSQAGSGGRAPDQLGSRGATESPMRTSDPSKTTKKKKSKKPAPTKSSSS